MQADSITFTYHDFDCEAGCLELRAVDARGITYVDAVWPSEISDLDLLFQARSDVLNEYVYPSAGADTLRSLQLAALADDLTARIRALGGEV